jgi:hypothetical protein
MTHHLTATVVKIQQMVRIHLAKHQLDWLRTQTLYDHVYETESDRWPDTEEWVEMHRFDHIHDD